MKKVIMVVCSFILISFTGINDFELSKSAWKKVEKSMVGLWPGFPVDTVAIDAPEGLDIKKMYQLQHEQTALGYMVFGDAPSRYDRFDFMIIYDRDFNILATNILVYRENYGGEISSKRWLGQFEGKNYKDKFKLDDDIVGISGATMSCRVASEKFKRITFKLHEMKVEGKY